MRFTVAYDTEFVDALCDEAESQGFPAGTAGERDNKLDHGMMIPLHFLKEVCGGRLPYKFVRIGLSGLNLQTHYQLGRLIMQASETLGRNTGIIASGDLSHKLLEDGPYGFARRDLNMTDGLWTLCHRRLSAICLNLTTPSATGRRSAAPFLCNNGRLL